MGSETGNNKSGRAKSTRQTENLGMSPMESQARFGNIAGAGLKPEVVSQQVSRVNELRQAQGREPSYTAQDLLRDKTATEMKYGREAILNPLAPDDSGRTITPSMLDSRGNIMTFTAAPPTFRELLGDASRAFTGGTAFTRAAGIPNQVDQQGILAALPTVSPTLNLLGFNRQAGAMGPPMDLPGDYLSGRGVFQGEATMTPTTPSREELLSRVGIESIPDATDSPAFTDMTPQDILEQPLESINEIVDVFKQSQLIEDMIKFDDPLTASRYLDMPAYKRAIELYRKYPQIYNQVVDQQI
jgi:hypothetical protein